ncbi:uncharacterized protein LOC110186668 [Drosophila serrata]|uniref:uncharacterized protein LOC110186668 n=1 Tax=Drosophila serrata TaxID=7274 RepID=UPI000A1D2CA6|nr:uncharacterized protein LOC110186668 [Drosophila serrata]
MCETVDPKTKPVETPREELMDWNSYYKNRGLISTRMAVKKSEYMHCSTYVEKPVGDKKAKCPSCCCSSCPVKDRDNYVPKCPGPGQKGKPNRDYMNCFATNMVALRLDMPGWEFECQDKLQVRANVCKGVKLVLDASRINVNGLPTEVLKTFQMEPECLARQLNEGIAISLIYMNKEIGRGCYDVPRAVINRMVNQTDEIVHDANIELTCCGCTVGLVHIRFSMLMRCQTLKEVAVERSAGGQERGCNSPERKQDRNVNPQDLSFMAEGNSSSSSLDPCAGFMPSDMESPPSFNSQEGVICDSPPDPQPQLIDMAGPFPVYSCPTVDDGCVNVTIEPPAGPSAQFSPEQQHVLGDGSTNRLVQIQSTPKLRQMHFAGTRCCILCGEDVSWLPNVAACPYCGYKAVPEFKEREYDENATAKQILQNHLNNPVEELSFDLGSVEGCSGDGGKAKDPGSTSEAFEDVVRDFLALKRSIRESSKPQVCPSVSQKPNKGDKHHGESRPQDLVKVFAELKELFKVKDVDEGQKIQDICSEACKLAKGKKGKSRLSVAGNKTSKTSAAPSSAKDSSEGNKKKKGKRRKTNKRHIKSKYYSMYSPQNRIRVRQDRPPSEVKVPSHMGWLWTAHPLATIPGWRPGAIRRSIRELMSYFLKDYPVDTIPMSKYMSYYSHKKTKSPPAERSEDLVQVPTLNIEKKNDVYTITLRPLKEANALARSANPYVDMKPVQFRIVKDPLLKKQRELKRCLKGMGFSKCTCHRPVMQCYCRSFVDKNLLVQHLQEECQRRHMEPCEDDLVMSDTSDSESEFEFGVTPPAGLMHPERLKSSHIKHTETQYDEKDWASPSLFPHPPHPEVQYASCVMGERKDTFNWVYGKGVIHEVPKPPKMRNIKKKKKKAGKKRATGGFAGHDYHDSIVYNRLNNNFPPIRLITPENHSPPNYSTDSELPLSGDHMRRLDQAAYPPTAPQRQEPWALEKEKERKRRRVKRRTDKLVKFDPSIGPRSSDSYDP